MLINILRQALNPGRALVMARKVMSRMFDPAGDISPAENAVWLQQHATSFSALASELNASLWTQTQQATKELEAHGDSVLAQIPHKLGGGGMHELLYFLVRFRQPQTTVETGVATGFSSAAILRAIHENGTGELFSSDFPYFRVPDPERYIGCVVPTELRDPWTLLIEGDATNLPKILATTEQIDLFHYDSDKSYSGRAKAVELISPVLNVDALFIMDDIDDNSFFHDHVMRTRPSQWFVFEHRGRHVGVIGKLQTANSKQQGSNTTIAEDV